MKQTELIKAVIEDLKDSGRFYKFFKDSPDNSSKEGGEIILEKMSDYDKSISQAFRNKLEEIDIFLLDDILTEIQLEDLQTGFETGVDFALTLLGFGSVFDALPDSK